MKIALIELRISDMAIVSLMTLVYFSMVKAHCQITPASIYLVVAITGMACQVVSLEEQVIVARFDRSIRMDSSFDQC